MDIGAGLLQLAGVALGGFIASASARAARTRDARADALRLLMRMRGLRRSWTDVAPAEVDSCLQEIRISFAGAGVSWTLIEEYQSVCVDSIAEANAAFLKARHKEGDSIQASKAIHPSHLFSRPYVKYGDLLESQIRTQLERPAWAKVTYFYWLRERRKVRSTLPEGFQAASRREVAEMMATLNKPETDQRPSADNPTPPGS
jgi:hypothetical protein